MRPSNFRTEALPKRPAERISERETFKLINLQFHDQVDFALVLVRLQQLDDVGVPEPVGKSTNKNETDYTNNFSVKNGRLNQSIASPMRYHSKHRGPAGFLIMSSSAREETRQRSYYTLHDTIPLIIHGETWRGGFGTLPRIPPPGRFLLNTQTLMEGPIEARRSPNEIQESKHVTMGLRVWTKPAFLDQVGGLLLARNSPLAFLLGLGVCVLCTDIQIPSRKRAIILKTSRAISRVNKSSRPMNRTE